MTRLIQILQEEFQGLHLRFTIARLLLAVFPPYTVFRLRRWLLLLAGFSIGKGTVIFDTPVIVGEKNIAQKLIIGSNCIIGPGAYFDLAGKIIIHDRAALGPQLTVITGTHDIGSPYKRLGKVKARDVEIGEGVWMGARCMILPGVKVGNGAVVAAGAVVNKDVPENTLVGGVPAKVIRELSLEDQPAKVLDPFRIQ